MIRYALVCANGHEFEGWFASSSGYDRQAKARLVECPQCGERNVAKALMAPAVATSRKRGARASADPSESVQGQQATSASPKPSGGTQLAALPAEKRELIEKLQSIKQQLLEGAENVGPRFPEEARKIHYGETKPRGIYGQASLKEASDLAEEGIDFLPLPDLPEDRN